MCITYILSRFSLKSAGTCLRVMESLFGGWFSHWSNLHQPHIHKCPVAPTSDLLTAKPNTLTLVITHRTLPMAPVPLTLLLPGNTLFKVLEASFVSSTCTILFPCLIHCIFAESSTPYIFLMLKASLDNFKLLIAVTFLSPH